MKLKNKQEDAEKEEHLKKYQHYYGEGVLDYDTHNRMVPNLGFYANQAGIPQHYLYTKTKHLLTDNDLKYLNGWNKLQEKSICGAYFTANSARHVERMHCMVAILLRNMTDAKFITVQQLLKNLKNDVPVDSKLVCIPNLSLPKKGGGDIASWETSAIVGWLLDRQGRGYQTVVFVDNVNGIESQYGTVIYNLITTKMCNLG